MRLAFSPGIGFTTVSMILHHNGTPTIFFGLDYAANTFQKNFIAAEPLAPDDDTFKHAALDLTDGTIRPYRCPTFIALGHELEHALEQIEALIFLRERTGNPNLIPDSSEFTAAVRDYYADMEVADRFNPRGDVVPQLMRLY
ncbi:MAG: hypothetical protein LBH53_00445, partial [Puniceicoccales bacterium]|nr:hypothetical protein [Puniceicoccales bacterium]